MKKTVPTTFTRARSPITGHRTVLEMEADGGRWIYVEDPDGIWIELC